MARSRHSPRLPKILPGAISALLFLTLLTPREAPVPLVAGQPSGAGALGDFEAQGDVGQTLPGSASYDSGRGIYLITGGGANMWEGTDAFHYVWQRAHGDFSLTANVQLVGSGGGRRGSPQVRMGDSAKPGLRFALRFRHAARRRPCGAAIP